MGRQFTSSEDVLKRLHGTICIYEGSPVYVMFGANCDTKHVNIHRVDTYNRYNSKNEFRRIDYTADTFRYKAFPLGYINSGDHAYYASRIPNRYQYYGLSPESIHWEPRPADPYSVIFSSGFTDMVGSNYPGIVDVESRLHRGARSVAFTNSLAIEKIKGRTVQLMFKGKPIAIKMTGDTFVMFDMPEANFLRKILYKAGVQV